MPTPDIGRDLCPSWNIAITFGMEKLEWCRYPMVKKIDDNLIRFNRIHERDRRTDTARRHMPRLCIASSAAKITHYTEGRISCLPTGRLSDFTLWLSAMRTILHKYLCGRGARVTSCRVSERPNGSHSMARNGDTAARRNNGGLLARPTSHSIKYIGLQMARWHLAQYK